MKKLLILIFVTFSLPVQAQSGHIADDVSIFYHGGPSNKYRITGRVNSGTPVTILKRDSTTKYVQIKTPKGKTGWVSGRNVDAGPSVVDRLPVLEANLKNSQSKVVEQSTVIEQLQSELTAVREERQVLANEVGTLKSEIKTLSFQMESMDESNLMRWFTHGGLVALGGVILGLLLRSFSGRRKVPSSTW
ncbi:MAG: TIGR04211 family SH3 domain-containing protein [Pontibacterium sp.]